MNKAVFLDRDGVLIKDVNYLSRLSQIALYDDVPIALKELKANGFKLIVVTNQSGVARGYFTEDFVIKTHEKINQILAPHQVQIDDFFHCPHHPDGHGTYKLVCNCRKPRTEMVERATVDHDIAAERSYMIGDKMSDIEFAVNAKLTGILVKTGYGLEESERVSDAFPQVFQCDSFQNAAKYILNNP